MNVVGVGVGVLCFLRPNYLLQRVEEIQTYLPKSPITVLVDRYAGSNQELIQRNNQVLIESARLQRKGKITKVITKSENVGVKNAFLELNLAVLEENEFSLYIEDDLRLKHDPSQFLSECTTMMRANEKIAIACLYDSIFHFPQFRNTESTPRLTYFPKMWGVLSRIEIFHIQSEELIDISSTVDEVFSKFELCRINSASGLASTWKWKMAKAIQSKSAWDTELQLRIWSRNMTCIAPDRNYVLDLGTDDTSVSRRRLELRYLHFPKFWRGADFNFCIRCESWGLTRYAERHERLRLLRENFRRIQFRSNSQF